MYLTSTGKRNLIIALQTKQEASENTCPLPYCPITGYYSQPPAAHSNEACAFRL